MSNAVPMVEIWRGGFLESLHVGHAVICDGAGQIVQAWGDANQVILPRSSCKMIQALPLVESGAAAAAHLPIDLLALSCASHQGGAMHTGRVEKWLGGIGLSEEDLRCGAHMPDDPNAFETLTCNHRRPNQTHNNCSGKHSGFLTLNRHLGSDPEYIDPSHPVQKAVREAFEDVTGHDSPGYGIDGCSAPNFATTVYGFARAMGFFAAAREDFGGVREQAAAKLAKAMRTYPELVAGEGRACTELMRAMEGKATIKSGAEGMFAAILPEQKLGVAVKISDGTGRASECAIAAILVKLGVLDPNHPATRKRMNAPISNCNGIDAAYIRPAIALQ